MSESFIAFLHEQGFINPKQLADGEWAAIMPLMFSMSVCCGIERSLAFKYRWCFSSTEDALEFFENLENFDDIPAKTDNLVGHRYLDKPLLRQKDALGLERW